MSKGGGGLIMHKFPITFKYWSAPILTLEGGEHSDTLL